MRDVLKNVQALRAIAALLVVGAHVDIGFERNAPSGPFAFSNLGIFGQFGVDIFFVVSGFIMVVTNWRNFGVPDVRRIFVLRRIARIYPLYWIVLCPIALVYLFGAERYMRHLAGHSDVLASIALLPQAASPLLPVSWTLTFEMFFYLVFAAFLGLRRSYLMPSLIAFGAFEIVAFIFFRDASNPYVRFLGMPLGLEFIFGAFVGKLYRSDTMPLGGLVGALGLLVAAYIWTISSQSRVVEDIVRSDLMRVFEFGLPAACIVYGAVALELRRWPVAPMWLVGLGDASYALYLAHVPIETVLIRLATRFESHGTFATAIVGATILIVVIAISVALHRFVEKPIANALHRSINVERIAFENPAS